MSEKKEDLLTIHIKQTATGLLEEIYVSRKLLEPNPDPEPDPEPNPDPEPDPNPEPDPEPFKPEYVFTAESEGVGTSAEGETKVITVTSTRTTEAGGTEPVGYTVAVTGTAADLVTATRGEDGKLTIMTKPATSYDPTTATVTLTQEGSGKVNTITVSIAGKADDGVFTADPSELAFESEGGTKSSTITSTSKGKTVGWTVSNKSDLPAWITLSGEGTGTLTITTTSNN
jgi:hypothetical protein